MADQTLLQPFLTKPATKTFTDSDSGILLRLFSVFFVGVISLWANHEASKGFSITIINEAKEESLSAKRFALFFESDDTAVRVLLDTSFFVERYLYYGVPHRLRKTVNHVTVRFSDVAERYSVTSGTSHGEYVIRLSSSLTERSDFSNAVKTALRRSMVRVWLWGGASPELVAGMVEYLAELERKRGRFDEYWEDKEFVSVAKWLGYCEGQSEGFMRRLNHGMRLRWDDRTVDLASNGACDSRKVLLRKVKDGR